MFLTLSLSPPACPLGGGNRKPPHLLSRKKTQRRSPKISKSPNCQISKMTILAIWQNGNIGDPQSPISPFPHVGIWGILRISLNTNPIIPHSLNSLISLNSLSLPAYSSIAFNLHILFFFFFSFFRGKKYYCYLLPQSKIAHKKA